VSGRLTGKGFLLGAAFALFTCLAACGSGGTDSSDASHGVIQRVDWRLAGQPRGQRIKIITDAPYCLSEPEPRLIRPRISRGRSSVVITARLLIPSPKPPRECFSGTALEVTREIRLGRPAADLVLLDGISSPPGQEWPIPKR
jgi:hypothetical protein